MSFLLCCFRQAINFVCNWAGKPIWSYSCARQLFPVFWVGKGSGVTPIADSESPDSRDCLKARTQAVNKMLACFNHLLQQGLISSEYWTRCKEQVLLAACLLPCKQSPESGDSERNGYWSYTKPFPPTQNTGKSGLGTRLIWSCPVENLTWNN